MPGTSTLYQQFLETASRHPSGSALLIEQEPVSWKWLAEAVGRTPLPPDPVVILSVEQPLVSFLTTLLAAWREGRPVCPVDHVSPSPEALRDLPPGICHIKLTSGSTGEPRLVAFRAEQLEADCRQIISTMGLHPDSPNLAVISAAHSYGFSNLILPLLLHGIPLVTTANALPGNVGHTLSQQKAPLTVPAVPAMWRAWHQAGFLSPNAIAVAISAGAPLPVDWEQEIHQTSGLKIHNFYGASECGGIAYDKTNNPRHNGSLTGSAMDGVNLSLNTDGCLVVSGRSVAEGYWQDGRLDTSAVGQGRFITSDLVSLEEQNVFLLGRSGDTINVAGRKVSPQSLEQILAALPGIKCCAIFGIPSRNPSRVEDIVATIAPDPGFHQEEVEQKLRHLLPGWQMPRHWWILDDLTPDTRGKINRSRLRNAFLEASPIGNKSR
jgi:long-chain acyl-CoA synthetase